MHSTNLRHTQRISYWFQFFTEISNHDYDYAIQKAVRNAIWIKAVRTRPINETLRERNTRIVTAIENAEKDMKE